MLRTLPLLAVAVLASSVSVARAATFHVATSTLPGVVADAQFRSINDAAQIAKAGDLVLIHDGVYRESVRVQNSGTARQPIRFESAPGARVVVSGADRLDAWEKVADTGADNVFVTAWPHHFIDWSPTMAHPNDDIICSSGAASR